MWRIFNLNTSKEISLTANPTAKSFELVLSEKFLTIGIFKIVFEFNASFSNPSENRSSINETYVEVVPSGIVVSSRENSIDKIVIGKNQALSLEPVKYSYDLDSMISMSSLEFKFYCKLVDRNLGFVNYLNNPGVIDLRLAKSLNSLSLDSCFMSPCNLFFKSKISFNKFYYYCFSFMKQTILLKTILIG